MEGIILREMTQEVFESTIRKIILETKGETNERNTQQKEILTTNEAAEFLKVTTQTIHNWKKHKGLKFHKTGKLLRFKRSDLIEFMESKKK